MPGGPERPPKTLLTDLRNLLDPVEQRLQRLGRALFAHDVPQDVPRLTQQRQLREAAVAAVLPRPPSAFGRVGEGVLFRDYGNNRPLYPLLHDFLRASEVPVLAVWGRNDEIFGPAGAEAFARDAQDAEVRLINGGHFLLESHLDVVAGYLRGFLGRVLG